MKNYINKFVGFFCIALAATLFTNCGDDEIVSTVSYTLNGDKGKVRTVSAFLETSTEYDHEGKSLFITAANGTSTMLSIAVANWDFQNPPTNGILEKTYDATFDYEASEGDNPLANCLALVDYEGVYLCDGALITLIGETDVYFSAFDGNTEASVTVTNCNTSKKTVSGTFTAKLKNFDETEEMTVSGTFKNVKYFITI